MRLSALSVGSDGRNRTLLSAFQARTGRNQPSNTKFIFGPAVWLRHLIKPPVGYGLAYIDWCQQEFGIAAALSGDPKMLEAYASGDPYLAFAKLAHAVPQDATKASHPEIRDLYKACILAVQYGMEAPSLARRIGQPFIVAHNLLRQHRKSFPVFWRWLDDWLNKATLTGTVETQFGWKLHLASGFNPRMVQNFPMQANGAEMLRIACCLGTEHGVEICAPVHDAVLIQAPLHRLDAAVAAMQDAMREASRAVLAGFELETDVKRFTYPDRVEDDRGIDMWRRVTGLLTREEVIAA
jgi:DNA polymerase I